MMYQNKFVVVVKSQDGKILRENGDIVYTPFGEEYSLQFKNLNSRKAVVTVEIDGEDVLNGRRLIIDANQSINLERFVDNLNEGNKFKFIKKIKEIQEHRGDHIDDGFIRVTFQYEKLLNNNWYPNTIYNSTSKNNAIRKYSDELCTNTNHTYDVQWATNSIVRNTSSKSIINTENSLSNNAVLDEFFLPQEDEGITVKGSKSNQSFILGNIGSLESEKHTLVLRLKGVTPNGNKVDKPLTVKTKLICTSCGKASDSSSEFCSRCGTALL